MFVQMKRVLLARNTFERTKVPPSVKNKSLGSHVKRVIAGIAVFLTGSAAWSQFSSLGQDEMQVLAAAISQTRLNGQEKWILLADETATFGCGANLNRVIRFADGCSGMRTRNEPIAQVILGLRGNFPQASDEVLADFRIKGDVPSRIAQPLPLPVKQFLWGPRAGGDEPPKELGNPDLAINVARVGFNRAHTEALTYIGTASWTGADRAYGEYIFLVKEGESWTVAGRSRMWDLGK